MWGIMLHSDVGVRSFRDTVVRGGPRVTFGLLTYQHLTHAFVMDLSSISTVLIMSDCGPQQAVGARRESKNVKNVKS